MNEFLQSLEKPNEDIVKKALIRLFNGVVNTNKLIGLGDLEGDEKEKLISTYKSLCLEEGKEGIAAVENKDKVEFLDFMVDYLVVGYYLHYLQEGELGKITLILDEGITRDYKEFFLPSFEDGDYINCVYPVQDMLGNANIDINKAVDEVLESNLSKFPTMDELREGLSTQEHIDVGGVPDEVLVEIQIECIEDNGRYEGVICREVVAGEGETRLVFWSTTEYGETKVKYLKPCTFKEPDFESCWN